MTVGRYIDDERNVKKKKSSRRRRGRSWRGVRTRGRLFLVPGGRGPRSRGKTASWLFLRDQETFPYPKNGAKKVPRRKNGQIDPGREWRALVSKCPMISVLHP